MNAPVEPIDYFGRHGGWLLHLKSKRSLAARRKMYDLFVRLIQPDETTKVVDVGVTPDQDLADSNAFEQFFPHPSNLTVTSIEDVSGLELRFPGVRAVQTKGSTLPFDDRSFDVAFSSAVLEHVGGTAGQRYFLSEVMRVADRFFVTTPNRWFPLELHTFIPFVHWLPRSVHRWLLGKVRLGFWAQEANLNLLSVRDIRRLMPAGADYSVHRHRLLGLTSNLIIVGSSPQR